MKHLKVMAVCLLLLTLTFAYAEQGKKNGPVLKSSSIDETVITFDTVSYKLNKVKGLSGDIKELLAPKMHQTLKKGAPEVLKMSAAVIVPDDAQMQVVVTDSQYKDYSNVRLAPSKGYLSRMVDPASIPYEYGKEYNVNAFYPSKLAEIGSPYIIRDYRGQAVTVYPFQYNPVTRVLRVYSSITVKVSKTGNRGENVMVRAKKRAKGMSPDFKNVYADHFINYGSTGQASALYTPLPDNIGNYLIVCYSGFMTDMSSFVTWKQSLGYNVSLVNYTTIGSSAALKTYVANQYNTNGLTYLLIVGDHAQVPTSSTTAGDSDNNYGYIVGSDKYLDIFVGRFSAETSAQVATQVTRTLWYERDLASSASYFKHAIGMASNEGPGHNNEYDAAHMDNIMNDLTGYGYTIHKNYQDGGSTANLSSLINAGAGAMFYCGHGSDTAWTCGWTFSSTNVNALTNENMLPVIFNVACVVGNFKSQTCFAEAWQRATRNGNPIGSIAHCASTINQDWNSPMTAQDEMADILIAKSKRTFGGVFVNGMFKMLDLHGTVGGNMADTWTVFGDPSVQLRTPGTPNGPQPQSQAPVANFTSNKTSVTVGGSVSFTDTSTGAPTSWSWTFNGGTPSSSTAQNPTVTYNTAGTYTVTLVASNANGNDTETKTNYITVSAGQVPVANFTASATTINAGQSVTFTDTSTGGPTSWSWSFTGGTPSTSTAQNPTVTYAAAGTYSVTLTAANSYGSDGETKTNYITVNPATPAYCASQSNNSSYEWLSNVKFGTFTNPSTASKYSDFTSKIVTITRGSSVSVTLTPSFSGSSYTEYFRVWIDLNKDGDFADAGEQLFSKSGKAAVTGTFTIPTTVATGNTRMRVSMKYSAYPTYCETFSYGEVEDYTVKIQ